MTRLELAQELQDALFAHPQAGPVPVFASLLTLVMEELRRDPERPPSGEMVMVSLEEAAKSMCGWCRKGSPVHYRKGFGWWHSDFAVGTVTCSSHQIRMLSAAEAEGRNGYAFTVDRKQFCSPQKRASIAELKAIYGRGGDEFWFVKDPSNKQTGRKTLYDAEIVDLEFTSEFYVDLPARM